MSDNPYNTPGQFYPGQPGGDPHAAERVKVPAIGLIVSMGIGLALVTLNLLQNILVLAGVMPMAAPQNVDPEMMEQFRGMQMFGGGIGILFAVLMIICGVVVILGAIKMKNLESYNFALTACILSLIPCLSPCCLLGLIFGIWGIVVLSNSDVKAAFRS